MKKLPPAPKPKRKDKGFFRGFSTQEAEMIAKGLPSMIDTGRVVTRKVLGKDILKHTPDAKAGNFTVQEDKYYILKEHPKVDHFKNLNVEFSKFGRAGVEGYIAMVRKRATEVLAPTDSPDTENLQEDEKQ